MSEDNFFDVTSGGDFAGDAPILLGGPSDEPSYFDGGDDMNQPSYLGDIHDAPPADDAPILLGPPSSGSFDNAFNQPEDASDTPEDDMAPSEPTPMQKWNAEWQETLLQRKDEENALKGQVVEQARIDMENFHAAREQKREAKMATNRSDEQSKLEAIEADLENDNSWQRVCKMVELSHDNKTDAEDVKRMRDVMILLKNEPARAVALTN